MTLKPPIIAYHCDLTVIKSTALYKLPIKAGTIYIIVYIIVVEMDICMASPRPDSLMLRGLIELAWTFTKRAFNAPGQLQTIYGHRVSTWTDRTYM